MGNSVRILFQQALTQSQQKNKKNNKTAQWMKYDVIWNKD